MFRLFFRGAAAKHAKRIHKQFDHRILQAAWDEFVHIKKENFQKVYQNIVPSWYALQTVQDYNGNFKKFTKDELPFLESLLNHSEDFDLIVTALGKHMHDENQVKTLFATHPNLHDCVPGEYDNPEQVIEYLMAVVQEYQAQLQDFSKEYKTQIVEAIDSLKGD